MPKEQNWPISVEMQFLAGLGDGNQRPTGNMCSPGTEIVFQGKQYEDHCLNSTSKTYGKDEWVRAELIVLGDFNIAPDDRDVHDPLVWNEDSILTSTQERSALQRLLGLGLHDSFRLHSDEAGVFSWWDYRMAGFRRNLGLRIDLVLISDALKSQSIAVGIEREPRTWERPSDHAPVWVEINQ